MTRRLGIILATTLVALLVMTDGAWACRCMNRLMNCCGNRRACCCILIQPCCQTVAMPACCQPAGGEMKAAEGAPNPAPIANKPAGGAGMEVVSPSNTKPDTKPTEPVKPAEPAKTPDKPAEPKPIDLQPPKMVTPEVPAEKRVTRKAGGTGKIPGPADCA